MGNSHSNNNDAASRSRGTSVIGNMLLKQPENGINNRELFHSDTVVDTLGWENSEASFAKRRLPNALDNFINSKAYFSDPESSVTEYIVTDFKGGYDSDSDSSDSTVEADGNDENRWTSDDNQLNIVGGNNEEGYTNSTNFSELTKMRKFIENDLQKGGGNLIYKGTRPLKGGRRHKQVSSDDENDDASDDGSAESGHLFSASSDTNVYKGYRMK